MEATQHYVRLKFVNSKVYVLAFAIRAANQIVLFQLLYHSLWQEGHLALKTKPNLVALCNLNTKIELQIKNKFIFL